MLERARPSDRDPCAALPDRFGGTLALEHGHPLSEALPEAANVHPAPKASAPRQVVAVDQESNVTAGADPRRGGSAVVVP